MGHPVINLQDTVAVTYWRTCPQGYGNLNPICIEDSNLFTLLNLSSLASEGSHVWRARTLRRSHSEGCKITAEIDIYVINRKYSHDTS